MTTSPGPTDIRALLGQRRTDDLTQRIVASLGRSPRPLPSRTVLAIEGMSSRLMVAAAVACAASLAIGLAVRAPERPVSIVTRAMEGQGVSAAQVYAAMTGLSDEGGQ